MVDYGGEDDGFQFAGIATTGSFAAPVRRLIVAGGTGVSRLVDIGSVVSIGSLEPNASETGPDSATFIVGRTQALPTPERVFIGTLGRATPPNTFPVRPRDYNGTNISFGNGISSSTYVDIPAGATYAVVTITPVDDTLVEGDETAVFTVGGNFAYDIGFPPPSTTLVIRDNDDFGPPMVVASQFVYQTAPQRVQFSFSQDVVGSIGDSDFQLTGPAGMPPHTFAYEQLTNTATLSFNGILPDGNYTARAIASGITNANGQQIPADSMLNFFFLNGDANRDRRVNLQDFNILAANFGATNRTFSQGDFSYDRTVNLQDFNILASRFGVIVASATGVVGRGGELDDETEELPDEPGDLLACHYREERPGHLFPRHTHGAWVSTSCGELRSVDLSEWIGPITQPSPRGHRGHDVHTAPIEPLHCGRPNPCPLFLPTPRRRVDEASRPFNPQHERRNHVPPQPHFRLRPRTH